MLDPRGSTWSKWDLHVHTPASVVHHYPGTDEEAWNAFIEDLERLPEEFSVLGINDYWFLDGYERLLEVRNAGRLENIKLLLPVVELRLNQFGGSESQLSRVNYHVIFSDALSPQVIREQFLSALSRSFDIVPRHQRLREAVDWGGVITRTSMRALGEAIIASVPEERRAQYGSPLVEGFNNLTVPLEDVRDVLSSSSFLAGRYVTAIGKTEWADIKWTDGSIADKKHIINGADCVFTAAESIGAYHRAREALTGGGVNDRLLDCSDAHSLSTAAAKDRIGNTEQWIKGDPTFSGLLQAIEEFDQRIYVGVEPPQARRVREHPSKYLDRVRIQKKPQSPLADRWFTTDLRLNAGLVAVIGNKGSGKSALAEVIGLVGGSPHEHHFSFLTPTKFRNPRHQLAMHFEGELTWHGEEPERASLAEAVEPGQSSRVQHLPQRYLESLCNEVPSGEKTTFDRELERILFDHLPIDQRLEAGSLEELVEIITGAIDTELEVKRSALETLNEEIASLEQSLEPEEVNALRSQYYSVRRDWLALRRNAPKEVPEVDVSDPGLASIRNRIQELAIVGDHITRLQRSVESELSTARRRQANLSAFRAKLEQLQEDHRSLRDQHSELLEALGLPETVSVFTVDLQLLDHARTRLASTIESLDVLASGGEHGERGLERALRWLANERAEERQRLSAPEEAREAYIQALADWTEEVRGLLGSPGSSDSSSLLGARERYLALRDVPQVLTRLRAERRTLAQQIHTLLMAKAVECARLYQPLQAYMDGQGLSDDYTLSVSTSLIDTGFSDRFLNELVNRQVTGSFSGVSESEQMIGSLLAGVNFDDATSVVTFLDQVDHYLRYDMRQSPPAATVLRRQVRKGANVAALYDPGLFTRGMVTGHRG
jgi:hypothetical protein